jgi:hypothetical protein
MQQTTLSSNDYYIASNGSKWQGGDNDSIDVLIENLTQHPLCPRFSSKGVKHPLVFKTTELTPQESEFSGEDQYIGNFLTVSAGFNIYVKRGSRTAEVLDDLIQKNINTFEYQMALGEHLNRTSVHNLVSL